MNPDNNNPLTNPGGTPDLGAPADPLGMNGASSPLAANPMDPMSPMANPSPTTSTEAPAASQDMGIENTIEEPLVPAAPVPGSIGSVTSVPPVDPAAPTAPAFPPADPAQPIPADPTAPVASAVPADPAAPQAPFNPFAQPAATDAPADAAVAAPAVDLNGAPAPAAPMTPPPVQPTNAPKATKKDLAKGNHLTLVLAIVAALGVIMAIVFAVLFFKEKNNTKIVYIPAVADDTTNSALEILSCSRENDFNYLIGYEHSVIGSQNVMLSYSGSKLSSISLDASATFDNESDASVAKDNYANSAVVSEVMVADYSVDGSTMEATFDVADGATLTDSDAATLIYGDGTSDADLSLSAVQAHYESIGYTCSLD